MDKRYVNIADAICAIRDLYPSMPHFDPLRQRWLEKYRSYIACEEALDRLPSVDVAPVVRCKDCKYHDAEPECMLIEDDWYCADGERRNA